MLRVLVTVSVLYEWPGRQHWPLLGTRSGTVARYYIDNPAASPPSGQPHTASPHRLPIILVYKVCTTLFDIKMFIIYVIGVFMLYLPLSDDPLFAGLTY